MNSTIASIVSCAYPSFTSAAGTVWLTICIDPPPTSFLNLTNEKSGSIPVVSQSIIKPIVPVGARTEICALRHPFLSPVARHASHALFASVHTSRSRVVSDFADDDAAACLRITRACGLAFCAKPAYGPTIPASSAERLYVIPDINDVIAPARARPPSESYARPDAIRSAPRFA